MNIKQAARIMGKRGGQQTSKRGQKYYQDIQLLGAKVRSLRVLKRRLLLKHFTVQDLDNPVTFHSIVQKLEQIDKENVIDTI